MNKVEFLKRWQPILRPRKAWIKENQKLYDEFKSDINELLEQVTIEQRNIDFRRVSVVLNLNERQINQLNKIKNTPLVTDKL